jgi:hypothetical protein
LPSENEYRSIDLLMSIDVNIFMKEKIEALRAHNPNITQAMVADELGVTRQRISQACKRHGIVLARGWRAPMPTAYPTLPRWQAPLNTTTKAAVGEMTVAADLMCRGFFVYRCLSQTGPFDLLAYKDGKMLRVEVRCGVVDKRGQARCAMPIPGRYDVLAVVLRDSIVYTPDDL